MELVLHFVSQLACGPLAPHLFVYQNLVSGMTKNKKLSFQPGELEKVAVGSVKAGAQFAA